MPTPKVPQQALPDAIPDLQARRALLGDALVDAALAPLLERLASLNAQPGPPAALSNAALGDAPAAIRWHEQGLVIRRAIGDRRHEAFALRCLGDLHLDQGDAQAALQCGQARPCSPTTATATA